MIVLRSVCLSSEAVPSASSAQNEPRHPSHLQLGGQHNFTLCRRGPFALRPAVHRNGGSYRCLFTGARAASEDLRYLEAEDAAMEQEVQFDMGPTCTMERREVAEVARTDSGPEA